MPSNRIEDCTPVLEMKVKTILIQMAAFGEKPKVYETLRTVAEQRKKVEDGVSKTMHSMHLPGSDGKARAADIADAKKAWGAAKPFWLKLAAAAHRQGLQTGGDWGLPYSLRVAFWRAVASQDWSANVKTGWDVAHVELTSDSWTTKRTKKAAGLL